MRLSRRTVSIGSVGLLLVGGVLGVAQTDASTITSPESFFGHALGEDKKLARWDKIVEYFRLLDSQSDRLQVVDLGPSTEGHPYLLAILSSPRNLSNLEDLRQINLRLHDPATTEQEAMDLAGRGKAVVSQSYGLHATEVAGAQAAPQLTYEMVTRTDPEAMRILDETILLLFPCFNPDGQIMVTDWYRRQLGTEYEGVGLPWLYHKYVGHDNNRDADFLNMVEAVYTARVLYVDWKPQAYVDHHQMGGYGARMFVPPYGEPIRPHADPLLWRELSWYGAHMAYKLEESGMSGILNAAQYPGWGHFGWHWITPFHNIAGMLTESASASLATPLFLHPDQLRGGARGLPEYEAQSTMPNPWPGGWWRLGDIVKQQNISAWALMDHAARNRRTVLQSAYLKTKRQTRRGAEGSPKTYVIPAGQHDSLTAIKMINTLLQSDISIQRARTPFQVSGMHYPAGTFSVSLAQPKTGLIRNLLGRTLYPDNEWTRGRDGTPLRPYDTSTHTMAELMGVRVDPVDALLQGDFETLRAPVETPGRVDAGTSLVLDGRQNDSFKAVNLLLDEGFDVHRVDVPAGEFRRGDFIVSRGDADRLGWIGAQTGSHFENRGSAPTQGTHRVARMRAGMYQRYRGGSMDEGWTRFLLEKFSFPYTSLKDAQILGGDLSSSYDAIILPHDSTAMITGEPGERRSGRPPRRYPPEYESGIGEDGVKALQEFVKSGGTLVTLGGASQFALDKFDLRVRNSVQNLDSREFFCPGSTLKVRFDNRHPLAYGLAPEGLALYWQGPVFQIMPSRDNDRYSRIVIYTDRDILQSGWLIGEEHLANKAAVVSAQYGKGEVILIGIRAQHRAQTHGTFKLLFNALLR